MSGDVWQRLERHVKATRTRIRAEVRTANSWFDSASREPSENVRALIELRRLVDDLIDEEIIRAHELGASFDSLGTSRQQAQQRYKRAIARRTRSTDVDEVGTPGDALRQRALTAGSRGIR